VACEQGFERPIAEHVIADVVEQLFLLGDRHHDRLDGDDLVDDVADFLAGRLGVELGELGEIDGFDQGAEDGALGLVIGLGMPRVGGGWNQRRRGLVGQAILLARRRRRDKLGTQTGRRDRSAAAFDDARACRRFRRGWWRRLRPRGGRRRVRTRRRSCGRRVMVGCATLSKHAPNVRGRSGPLAQFLEYRRQEARLALLHLGAPGQRLSERTERLRYAMAWREFGDHLPVIGGSAEDLRLERNDYDLVEIGSLAELQGGGDGGLRDGGQGETR